MKRLLTAAVCLGILLRLLMVLNARAIGSDGTHYARIATELSAGNIAQASTQVFPPFYPAVMVPFAALTGEMEMAGRIVAALCGFLLIVPAGLLAKEIFGPRVAALTAAVLALHPEVLRRSAEVRSETLAAMLTLWAVYLGWRGFARRSVWRYALLGLLLGAAYLTRPEMAGFLGLIGLWTLGAALRRRPGEFGKHLVLVLIASVLFAAVAFPYMDNLKTDTGKWQISKKPFYQGDSVFQIASTMAQEKAEHFASDLFEKFPGSISYFLFAFLLLGLTYRRRVPRNGWGELYILFLVVIFFLILPPGHPRFFFMIGILSIPFAVVGMIEAVGLVTRSAVCREWTVACTVVLGLGVLTAAGLRAAKPINAKREVEKHAGYAIGDYVKENAIDGFVVHSVMPQAAYYSGGEFARLQDKDATMDYRTFQRGVDKLHGTGGRPVFVLIHTRRAGKNIPWLLKRLRANPSLFRPVGEAIPDCYRSGEIRIYRYKPERNTR